MRGLLLAGAWAPAYFGTVLAQVRPVTRAEAVAVAVAQGPRVAVARSDSAAAVASVSRAKKWENPLFAFDYTRDTPKQHYSLGIPLPFPSRGTRIDIANLGLTSATQRLTFERESVAYDADTTYTAALVAAARARLSARAARDADSLLTLATLRRDAGDASDLEVELATVSAGQLANAAAGDSLEAADAVIAVQALMGLPTVNASIAPADTLDLPPPTAPPVAGTSLRIAAAESDARAAQLGVSVEHRWLFTQPALVIGFETDDPGGSGNQLLPTIGFSFPLPLFNQNGAGKQAAIAARDRANAELALQRIELTSARARAERGLIVARERVTRSLRLAESAERVVSLALLAYREGAATLPVVIEAQRTSRGTLFQVLDDIAAVRNSAGLIRLLSLTADAATP
jgi:cobalt-zinc-cadmium efflux system outer membrane protein